MIYDIILFIWRKLESELHLTLYKASSYYIYKERSIMDSTTLDMNCSMVVIPSVQKWHYISPNKDCLDVVQQLLQIMKLALEILSIKLVTDFIIRLTSNS